MPKRSLRSVVLHLFPQNELLKEFSGKLQAILGLYRHTHQLQDKREKIHFHEGGPYFAFWDPVEITTVDYCVVVVAVSRSQVMGKVISPFGCAVVRIEICGDFTSAAAASERMLPREA